MLSFDVQSCWLVVLNLLLISYLCVHTMFVEMCVMSATCRNFAFRIIKFMF